MTADFKKNSKDEWLYSTEHRQICRVLDVQTLWGQTLCRIWLPDPDAVVRVPSDQLKPLEAIHPALGAHYFTYIVTAAKVADALTQDVLLAPIESSVIPLPHQIWALSRAIANDRVRYLLADEVGLGKTIEAGLIMRELKLRGLVERTLVVAPRGLVTQWVSEMRVHFNETFQLLIPEDVKTLNRISHLTPSSAPSLQPSPEANPWRFFHQVVVPMDSVKPLDKRRGWTGSEVAQYNRERFDTLVTAGWDLVIVDEAHRLGGSTDQVARYKLGRGLAEAAPYLLLLSATPHQGKTDAFHRLISLLDAEAFPDLASVSRERVFPYVIRTEKRHAIDAQGQRLFLPRQTQRVPVSWEERHREQQRLYEAVTEYVREGYNQAMQEKKNYIGFLLILMQRLVTSSTRVIHTTLERRLEVLQTPDEQLTLFSSMAPEDEWADLDGQEQLDALLQMRLRAIKNERAEVKRLLEVAKQTEARGPDAKAKALLDWMYRLQQEERDPELKLLIFTEFVPTQEMLREFLTDRGFRVVCLNGSMRMEERIAVQNAFANEARILISTAAGGEGLNLQFCHVVINYDLPWNPMRLEQRIGRVDRIGQSHIVRALNFVLEDTVEYRVQEVLEEKLAVILEEFGIDKTGDVLDSAQAGQIFDELYVNAILHPEALETRVESVVSQVHAHAKSAHENMSVLGAVEALDPTDAQRLMAHPLPHWIEAMTVSYLQSSAELHRLEAESGGVEPKAEAIKKQDGHTMWRLVWPDGHTQEGSFTPSSAVSTYHLGLEDARIRGLAMRLPRFAPGQPIPYVLLSGLPAEVRGLWSLWRITLHTVDWHRQRVMALFLQEDGRILQPTARYIWEELLSHPPRVAGHIEGEKAKDAFERARASAETQGKSVYDGLVQAHREHLQREREKGAYTFAARRRAIERMGLQSVRNAHLAQLAQEEGIWRRQLEKGAVVSPDMVPLVILEVRRASC